MDFRDKQRDHIRSTVFIFVFAALFASTNDADAFQWKQTCDDNASSGNKCERGEEPLPLVWKHSCLQFGMSNSAPRHPERAIQGIQNSFDAWNSVACSGVSVEFDPSGSHDNSVGFKSESWEHSRSSFAITAVSYNPNSGEISSADIEVNEVHYDFEALESGPSPHAPDLQNTITHEVGHALGFGHSAVSAATMFGGARTGETDKRSLHNDDIDGLCDIYERGAFGGVCESNEPIVEDQPAEDAPEDEDFGWGGGSGDESFGSNEPSCSVTAPARSVKLPFGALLLFIAFSLLVRYGASTGAVRTRRHPERSEVERDRG